MSVRLLLFDITGAVDLHATHAVYLGERLKHANGVHNAGDEADTMCGTFEL